YNRGNEFNLSEKYQNDTVNIFQAISKVLNLSIPEIPEILETNEAANHYTIPQINNHDRLYHNPHSPMFFNHASNQHAIQKQPLAEMTAKEVQAAEDFMDKILNSERLMF